MESRHAKRSPSGGERPVPQGLRPPCTGLPLSLPPPPRRHGIIRGPAPHPHTPPGPPPPLGLPHRTVHSAIIILQSPLWFCWNTPATLSHANITCGRIAAQDTYHHVFIKKSEQLYRGGQRGLVATLLGVSRKPAACARACGDLDRISRCTECVDPPELSTLSCCTYTAPYF